MFVSFAPAEADDDQILANSTGSGTEVNGLRYTVTAGEASVTGHVSANMPGGGVNVVIPATVNIGGTDFPVTSIGASAFYFCTVIETLVLPDSVKTVGASAFTLCTSLRSIDLASVETLSDGAFMYTLSLESIVIPSTCTSIGKWAFLAPNHTDTSLVSVTIQSAAYIGFGAFQNGGKITHLDLGSATYIGEYAFYHCHSLTSVVIPDTVATIDRFAFENCEGLVSITIPSSVTLMENGVFSNCFVLGAVAIPYGATVSATVAPAWIVRVFYEGAESVTAFADISATPGTIMANGAGIELTIGVASGDMVSGITVGTSYGDDDVTVAGANTLWSFDKLAANTYYVALTVEPEPPAPEPKTGGEVDDGTGGKSVGGGIDLWWVLIAALTALSLLLLLGFIITRRVKIAGTITVNGEAAAGAKVEYTERTEDSEKHGSVISNKDGKYTIYTKIDATVTITSVSKNGVSVAVRLPSPILVEEAFTEAHIE